jgi:hypothetical protein
MSLLPIFGASPYVCNAQKVIGPPLSTHEKGTLLVGGLGAATGAIIGAAAGAGGLVPPSAVYLVRAVVTWSAMRLTYQQREIERQRCEITNLGRNTSPSSTDAF